MAPILIDSRAFFKLGFTVLIITTLIFFGGFFAGYKKASKFYQFASEVQQLPLPAVAENDSAERNPPTSDGFVRGENIDVDQPAEETDDLFADQSAGEPAKMKLATAGKIKSKAVLTVNPAVTAANKEKIVADSSEVMAGNKTAKAAKKAEVAKIAAVVFEPVDIKSIDMDKVKYSIQVGVYGNIINAENMVKMLQVQNLNAYISDYKNKKDEVRYNVRFGYFQDKRSAVSTLKGYRAHGKGDGYLVSFSAENLVNMAKTGTTQNNTSSLDVTPDVKADTKASENKSPGLSKIGLSQVSVIKLGSAASY